VKIPSVPTTIDDSVWFFDSNEKLFRKIILWVFVLFLLLSIVVPFLPVFEVEREKKEKIPPRIAKVLLKKKQPPPPKPPAVVKKPKPEQSVPEKKKQEKKPKKVAKKKKPSVKKKKAIQKKVNKIGLLALRSDLTDLHNDPVLERISNPKRKLVKSSRTKAKTSRSQVVKDFTKGSGGIDKSKLSNKTTKTVLADRSLTKVTSSIKTSGDETRRGDDRVNVRTIEDIRLILERHKGSFTTLYNRQLRKSPGLKGTVLFELTIAPSGQVIKCKILQSELNSPRLEKKFVIKLRSLDFGAKDVETTVIEYPLDFFPS